MLRIAFMVQTVLVCALGPGCSCGPRSGSIASDHAAHYREHGDHASLRWVAENLLRSGMTEREITDLLGPGIDAPVDDRGATRVYPSHRDIPEGHLLFIHYAQDRRVQSWEWASE